MLDAQLIFFCKNISSTLISMFRSPRGRAVRRSSVDNKNESDYRLHRAVADRDQDMVKELIQQYNYDIDEADKVSLPFK